MTDQEIFEEAFTETIAYFSTVPGMSASHTVSVLKGLRTRIEQAIASRDCPLLQRKREKLSE